MASGKGSKGSTNAAEPPSVYGKGHDIETNGFGPDTVINRNANYGAKIADPSYGVSNKPIGDYQLGTTNPSRSYTTGTSRTGIAAGAEEKIWLKTADGTSVPGVPGRKVSGSLGRTGISVEKPKVPDVPKIKGSSSQNNSSSNRIKISAGDRTPKGNEFTIHGAEQATKRGYSPEDVDNIISTWTEKLYQSGGRVIYIKKQSYGYDVVVVDKNGKSIISVIGGNANSGISNTLGNMDAVRRMLNNQGGYSTTPVY